MKQLNAWVQWMRKVEGYKSEEARIFFRRLKKKIKKKQKNIHCDNHNGICKMGCLLIDQSPSVTKEVTRVCRERMKCIASMMSTATATQWLSLTHDFGLINSCNENLNPLCKNGKYCLLLNENNRITKSFDWINLHRGIFDAQICSNQAHPK